MKRKGKENFELMPQLNGDDLITENDVVTISGALSNEIDSDISTHVSDADAHHNRSHTITSVSDHTAGNWKVLYTDGSGNVQELALTTSGTVLTSQGASVAPSWEESTGGGVAETLAAVQARRTTTYALTSSYADITFDATDIETDADIIEHNNTNTDRIDIKDDGTYLVIIDGWVNSATGSVVSDVQQRVRSNDSTVINGSSMQTSLFSDTSIDARDNVPNSLHNTFIATLSSGDYLTLQLQYAGPDTSTVQIGLTFKVIKLEGAQGADGAPGSGSTITLEEGGASVTNTPHDTIDFDGDDFDVTDNADGSATVTLASPGTIVQVVKKNMNSTASTTTTIPYASTPSSSSGDAFDNLSITMTDGANDVHIQFNIHCDSDNDSGFPTVLVIRNSTVIGVATGVGKKDVAGYQVPIDMWDSPGSGTHTYYIRVGTQSNTAYFNQTKMDSTPWGGTFVTNTCWLTLTEVT